MTIRHVQGLALLARYQQKREIICTILLNIKILIPSSAICFMKLTIKSKYALFRCSYAKWVFENGVNLNVLN